MTNKVFRTYRIYDADKKTLALMEFYYNETEADIRRLLRGLYELYDTMAGYELVIDNTTESYNDGPEDNLHYINER